MDEKIMNGHMGTVSSDTEGLSYRVRKQPQCVIPNDQKESRSWKLQGSSFLANLRHSNPPSYLTVPSRPHFVFYLCLAIFELCGLKLVIFSVSDSQLPHLSNEITILIFSL
jgi:hypothetical protein